VEEAELRIVWTAKAVSDLENIFLFLSSKSETAALKTIDKIYNSVSVFKKGFLKTGQKEILLNRLSKEYRYLISGNYKIIYSFSLTTVFIHTIFDTRQNPKKLKTKT
jgi:plasmid stabilization system protein ParE